MNKINKKDYEDLLDTSSQLLVTVKAWNLHNTILKPRDADTGKPVNSGGSVDALERVILRIRRKELKQRGAIQ